MRKNHRSLGVFRRGKKRGHTGRRGGSPHGRGPRGALLGVEKKKRCRGGKDVSGKLKMEKGYFGERGQLSVGNYYGGK